MGTDAILVLARDRSWRMKGLILRSTLPEDLRLKEAELASEKRRLENFLNFIAEGRGSKALAKALEETERRVDALAEDIAGLQSSREKVFTPPPMEWIRDRLSKLQKILEQNTTRSALVLREFLGPIRLEPVKAEIGRPYYLARTSIDTLALIDTPPDPSGPGGGSNSLRSWTRSQRIRTAAEIPPGGRPRRQPKVPVRSSASAGLRPRSREGGALGVERVKGRSHGGGNVSPQEFFCWESLFVERSDDDLPILSG